ncbi:hypothetical protein CSAL01_07070 [Colletotrichum salicis]|uniref:Uncharacterized protein n=1 Tax=Colletotrichum salicis TaxID=1209931 RepID=A0A135UJ79_9PEZI|nr:hypothetical protein CSAL01_07070 [Colletotrichum salicis]
MAPIAPRDVNPALRSRGIKKFAHPPSQLIRVSQKFATRLELGIQLCHNTEDISPQQHGCTPRLFAGLLLTSLVEYLDGTAAEGGHRSRGSRLARPPKRERRNSVNPSKVEKSAGQGLRHPVPVLAEAKALLPSYSVNSMTPTQVRFSMLKYPRICILVSRVGLKTPPEPLRYLKYFKTPVDASYQGRRSYSTKTTLTYSRIESNMGKSSKSTSASHGRSSASSSNQAASTSYGASQYSSTSSQVPAGYYSQPTTSAYGNGRQAPHDPYSSQTSGYGQHTGLPASSHHSSASAAASYSSQASVTGSYSSNYESRPYDEDMSPAARGAYARGLPGLPISSAPPPQRNHSTVIGAVQSLGYNQGYSATQQYHYAQNLDLGGSSSSRRGSSSRQEPRSRSSR